MNALERCERSLARIARDARLNAWSFVASAEALAAARASDVRHLEGRRRGPLDGQLVAIKGNLAVAGWPHEGGLTVRAGVRASVDAPVVARLRAAGAVLLGLTTMDEGALGADGIALSGPIHHPSAFGQSVGGSSGGSAVAVAAGHCDFALGSDTIGSVRIPAALTGTIGFKPSSGRLDTAGLLPVHPRFDHVGPLVSRLEQLPAILAALGDPTGIATSSSVVLQPDISIGVIEDLTAMGVSSAVESAYQHACRAVARAGVRLQRIRLAPLDPARLRRAIFALAEHAMWQQHCEHWWKRPQDYSPRLSEWLRYGSTLTPDRLATFEKRIADFCAAWREQTDELVAVLTPTTPVLGFAHDSPPATLADLTALATAAAAPALSVPGPVVETSQGSQPQRLGLQFIGSPGDDHRLYELVTALSSALR